MTKSSRTIKSNFRADQPLHPELTYAYNTVGNVLGVLVTSLLLIPALGLRDAFHVNLALSLMAGVIVLAVANEATALARALPVAALAAVVAVYAVRGTGWTSPLLYSLNHLDMTAPEAGASEDELATHPSASFAN